MEIKINERLGKDLDDILTPDDNIIFRCTECQTFLLPKEIRMLKAPVRDKKGLRTFAVIELCPVCYKDNRYILDEMIPQSYFITMNREEYEVTRQYERAGLISPVKNSNLIEVVN